MIVAQLEGQPFIRWDWVWDHTDLIWSRLVEHLLLMGIALAVGLAISVVLALISIRWRRVYAPITWITGALYTIPSLALFVMLIPVTGLSVTTAEIALVSYTLLIFTRNIVAGIDGVPPEVREAALGMGYTRRRMLLEIEIPLAMPVIVAGMRIATVTTVGLVTVSALIGQGGLGQLILDGLNRLFTTPLLVGSVLSVFLAVGLDLSLIGIERLLSPWTRRRAGL